MRVLFVGTVEFSLCALKKLIEMNVNVVGVCTKEMSLANQDYANLQPVCESNNIPCRHIDDINSTESIDWIRGLNPDVIFCFGWSSLIKSELLNLPELGVVGYHPARLPLNRGRHPLIWALVLGLKSSASTFFFMDEGADSGDMLSQVEFDILYEDTAEDLYRKIVEISLAQLESFVPLLISRSFTRVPQKELLANSWRKRNIKDGLIDFRMTSYAVYNLVRALSRPYVGAHLEYNGKEIKVWKVEEVPCKMDNIEPGKVMSVEGDVVTVKCYTHSIKIIEHDFVVKPKPGEYL